MPYLRMGYSYDEDRFEFILFNEGLGPAYIEEVNIYYNGKKYANYDASDFFQNQYSKIDSTLYLSYASVSSGTLFAAGKEIHLITKRQSIKDSKKLQDLFFNKKIEMEIIYASIYGEKWVARGAFTRPKKLDD